MEDFSKDTNKPDNKILEELNLTSLPTQVELQKMVNILYKNILFIIINIII